MENLILSPHYDDAVLSSGGLIKLKADKTSVITVFARPYNGLTEWDLKCGLKNKENAVEIRRNEDKNALLCLGCQSFKYLDFYEEDAVFLSEISVGEQDLEKAIDSAINAEPDAKNVYLPMGIKSNDHIKLRMAVLNLLKKGKLNNKKVFLYEDFPYLTDREEYHKSLRELRKGFFLEPLVISIRPVFKDKIEAILKYRTQIKPIFLKEDFHQIEKSILSGQNKLYYLAYSLFGLTISVKERYWLIKNK